MAILNNKIMATIKLNKEKKDQAYRRFVPDQVLTATQLNDVVDHFECQDRLSRICLLGVGIVCGLQVKYNENTSIEVTKGCAVTTDGDLISFDGAIYTHFRPFVDTEAQYRRFLGVPLLELVTDREVEEDNAANLETVENLSDMVVVLYLEYYCKDETLCTSTDCDTQGQEQLAKIRLLLITKQDAQKISNKDNDPIFNKHNNTKKFIDLPEIDLKRVVLQNSYVINARGEEVISQNSNTADYTELRESYRKAIQDTPVLGQLKNGITKLFTDFNTLLQTDSLIAKAVNINKKIDELFAFNLKTVPLDIQYRYDLLKDLLDTYYEIKCLVFDLRLECCPDIGSFPKHLLLAELVSAEEYLQCRHSFYPSHILPHGKERLEEIRALILKTHFMVQEYTIKLSPESPIKVTPSKDCDKDLSDRAIPYYYATSPNLVKNWDYEKDKKFLAEENLGYRSANLSDRDAIQNPLDYCIDDHDFYRIEGHLGKDYRTALRDLDTIKTEKGLAFDIKVLSIDESLDAIDPADFECEFEDLNAVLRAWRAEQDCLNAGISKFFSGFSLKEEGRHKFYTLEMDVTGPITLSGSDSIATTTPLRTERVSPSLRYLLTPRTTFGSGLRLDTAAINASLAGTRAFQPIYKRDTVVIDNLETDEDVLGVFVEKAIKEKPEGSAVDIAAVIKTAIDQNPEITSWDENARKVAIEQPYEILAYTKVATRFIPNTVSELTLERVDLYDKTVRDLCGRVETFKKNMTGLLFNKDINYIRKGYEEQYSLLLNQLSINCCAAEKIKVLLAEIQERKEKILERKLLSKFVEKHAGLEHKAGVKPGGTFIMVYKGRDDRAPLSPRDVFAGNVLTDVTFNPGFSTGLTNLSALERINPGVRTFGGINIRDLDPSVFNVRPDINILRPGLLDDLVFRPTLNVTENTVVADFALPYICCSDCAPIAFIVPKDTVSLRLPVDFICFDEETEPIAFEVSPSDGIVAADVDAGLVGGVIQIDGQFFFDASKISEELFGQEIKFTVNGQFTDTKITVFRKPQFDFTPSEPRYFKDNSLAVVNFTVQGDELPDGVTYFWDFGDGGLADNRTDENPRHEYNLPVNEDNLVEVSLTITNGKCSTTETREISFASFSLKVEQVCLGDTALQVGFTAVPPDAVVATTEEVEGLKVEGTIIVDPASFKKFGTPIKFTVNNIPTSETLVIFPRPKAVFEAEQLGNELVLTNISENSDFYVWSVNGKTTERNNRLALRVPLTANSPRIWVVSLEGRSETCGSDIDGPRTITVEIDGPPIDNFTEVAITRVLEDNSLLERLDTPVSTVVDPERINTLERFKTVTDSFEEFATGRKNRELRILLEEPITRTGTLIKELGANSEVSSGLLKVFEPELKLLYNTIGGQNKEALESPEIKVLLDRVVEIKNDFKEKNIEFSDDYKAFVKKYMTETGGQGKATLDLHFKTLKEERLL